MTFKNMDDILREREEQARDKFKENITDDIDDIMKDLFTRFKGENVKRKKERKKNEIIFIKILKILGIISLGLLILNFIIGNIWLLRFFIKSLLNL